MNESLQLSQRDILLNVFGYTPVFFEQHNITYHTSFFFFRNSISSLKKAEILSH